MSQDADALRDAEEEVDRAVVALQKLVRAISDMHYLDHSGEFSDCVASSCSAVMELDRSGTIEYFGLEIGE